MNSSPNPRFDVVHLFPILDKKLLELLRSLSPDEWRMQTVAKLWNVKDVAAHLLDGNIRILSMLRDNYWGEKADITSYQDLVNFLNGLNADWVRAMKRVSPEILILLLESTGKWYGDYYASLDPLHKSVLAVDWAGETESKNWMHIAREYSEKWLHQQQIRDAVNKPGLMSRDFFYPFIDIFMLALPHTYKDVTAENGSILKLTVSGNAGGSWFLHRIHGAWELGQPSSENPTTEVIIDPNIAWKLFSKSIRPEQIINDVSISGNYELGRVALTMVSVIA